MSVTERCKATRLPRDNYESWHPPKCTRKAVRDGFCNTHHPDTIAARNRASQSQYEAKWKADMERRRLESAAPDLLEALEELVRLEPITDDGEDSLERAREKAKAAIAKARGTSGGRGEGR